MNLNRYARLLWAGRELLLHPGTTLLIAFSIGLLTTLLATGLLLSQALTATTNRLLSQGPDLVVRRLNPAGWQPISEQATAAARAIPGIIDAYPRIWGTAQAPQGIVTAVAMDPKTIERLNTPLPVRAPNPGEALVGQGVAVPETPSGLNLHSTNDIAVRVTQRLPPEVDLVAHDLVMLHPEDARELFGLSPGDASDLALRVFHPNEAVALLPELSRAFPWPVHIATRQATRQHYVASFGRRGGLGLLLYIPATVALILLVAGVIRQQIGGRARVGLLKALGWTSRNIVTLQITKALLVGLPAVALGLMIAYGMVYAPLQRWTGYLLLGWQETAPLLNLDAGYAMPVFMEVTGMVLVPFLVAVLWSSLVQAAADPQDLLNEGC